MGDRPINKFSSSNQGVDAVQLLIMPFALVSAESLCEQVLTPTRRAALSEITHP